MRQSGYDSRDYVTSTITFILYDGSLFSTAGGVISVFERFVQAAIITLSLQAIIFAQATTRPTPTAEADSPTADVVAMLEKIEAVFLNR